MSTSHPLKHSGFTLVELMIVVAIIGILSAIAVPSYSKYILRGKVKAAQADLLRSVLIWKTTISVDSLIQQRAQPTLQRPQHCLVDGTLRKGAISSMN